MRAVLASYHDVHLHRREGRAREGQAARCQLFKC